MRHQASIRQGRGIAADTVTFTSLMLVMTPAMAHVGVSPAAGAMNGLLHPLGGIDHLLVMVAVGAWAGLVGGRHVWAVPGVFVVTMLIGALLALIGPSGLEVDPAIAVSVLTAGVLLVHGARLPLGLAAAMIAAFGGVHGYAHGSALASAEAAPSFIAGLTVTTIALHAVGIAVTRAPVPSLVPRTAGVLTAVAGAMLLF